LLGGGTGNISRHDHLIAQLDPMLATVDLILHNPRCAAILDSQAKSRHFRVPCEVVRLMSGSRFDLRNILLNEFDWLAFGFHFIPFSRST
jgi:hypothetical protein